MVREDSGKMKCDVCGTRTRVESYTITRDEGVAVVDLCPGDAKPLIRLWEAGSTEPRKRVTGDRKRGSGHAVIPVD